MDKITPEKTVILTIRSSEASAILSFLKSEEIMMGKNKSTEDLKRAVTNLILKLERQLKEQE